jgi:cytochrome bd ubiquinol oxidase subunit II
MMIDYGTLKIIWWLFIAALFVLFFIFGGRDFGACILLPWAGKDDIKRRLIINSVGTTWEGNQVWFITAGGATFAAWPLVYATAFSGLYYALLLVLLALIIRPVGFDYRSKSESKTWRNTWDLALFISGLVPSLIFGVALGNLFLGFPFHFDEGMRSHYEGSFWQLLTPMTVLFGVACIAMMAFHGGLFLQAKIGESVLSNIKRINFLMGSLFVLLFIVLGYWVTQISGFHITSMLDINASVLPASKSVEILPKAWLANYSHTPQLWALPIVTLGAVILALICSMANFPKVALTLSSLGITGALGTAGVALFPFIFPSSTTPSHSLTIWDSVSSHRTLFYMFIVAVVFLPIVLSYTFWVFRVLRGKLTANDILSKNESY